MIYLGLTRKNKSEVLATFIEKHALKKVVICSPKKFDFNLEDVSCPVEFIDWPEIIMYRTYYRLLEEIDGRTLVVVNECLRTQNRHDLTYNCIRHFLNQAGHVLVFQWIPIIDSIEDFMTLFDFATGSKWKREKFSSDLIAQCQIGMAINQTPALHIDSVFTDAKLHAAYQKERDKLFSGLGAKDPDTIPRNLYLLAGKAKLAHVNKEIWYLSRNNRFKLDRMQTYKENAYPNNPYAVFELPHNFIDFIDASSQAEQTNFDLLASDLKVDRWYQQRYADWIGRVADAIHQITNVYLSTRR